MARQTAMRTGPTRAAQATSKLAGREGAAQAASDVLKGVASGMPTGGPSRQAPLKRLSPGVYRDAQGRLTNSAGRPMRAEDRRPDYRFDNGGVPGRMADALGSTAPQGPATRPPAPLGPTPQGFDPGLLQEAMRRAEAIRSGGVVSADYNPERDKLVNQILGRQPGGPPVQSQSPINYIQDFNNPGQPYRPPPLMLGQGLPQYNPFGNYLADMYSQVQQKPLTPEMSQQQFMQMFPNFRK